MAEASSRSPLIALRIPRELDDRLRAYAKETGSTITDVTKAGLELILADDAPAKPARVRKSQGGKCAHRQSSGAYCAKCGGVVP